MPTLAPRSHVLFSPPRKAARAQRCAVVRPTRLPGLSKSMSNTHVYPSHTGTTPQAAQSRDSLRIIASNPALSPEIRRRAASALLLATVPGRGTAGAINAVLRDMADERATLVLQH